MKRTLLLMAAVTLPPLLASAADDVPPKVAAGASAAGTRDTQPSPAAAPEGDDAEIREHLRAYLKAFNDHDVAAVMEGWTADGVSVDLATGERTAGREALQQDFAALFAAHPQVRLFGSAHSVRKIRPDVAIVEGQVTLVTGNDDPVESAFSAVLVKEGDRWLISNSQERDIPAPASAHEALQELEWLIGTWQDQTDDVTVNTAVRWSPNQTFLIRAFDVQYQDGATLQGTQIIGWDPLNKQIRTWTFNSDGSFGEGFASKNGQDWMIKMAHVLSDGRTSAGTQIISRVDDDTIRVQTIGETIDGEPQPASNPVTVVRVGPTDDDHPETETTPISDDENKGETP